jgi:hypothetical protein
MEPMKKAGDSTRIFLADEQQDNGCGIASFVCLSARKFISFYYKLPYAKRGENCCNKVNCRREFFLIARCFVS